MIPDQFRCFMRPQEIPVYVAEGLFDIGICGLDWVMERQCLERVVQMAALPIAEYQQGGQDCGGRPSGFGN